MREYLHKINKIKIMEHETSSDRSRDEQTITEVRNSECPICFNSMENSMTITTRCLHTYCYDCLTNHMNSTQNINENRHRKCPCCRENLFENDDNDDNIINNATIYPERITQPPPFPIINNTASIPIINNTAIINNSQFEFESFQNELETELNITSSEIQEILDYYENRNEDQVEDQVEDNNNEESLEIIDNNNPENQPTYLEHINNNEVTYNNNYNIFRSMLMENLNNSNRIMNNSNIPERIMEGEGLQNVTLTRG